MPGGLNKDNDHAVESTTGYEAQKSPRRSGRSGWSLAIAAIFLLGIASAFLFWPESRTDPAPGGQRSEQPSAGPASSNTR